MHGLPILAVTFNKILLILLAFDFKELQIICKPRHMKCFQTIFSNSYLLTSSYFFPDVSLARLGLMFTCRKNTILCWIFEPTFQFLSYIIYKLLHTELYASVLASSSFSSTSAVLDTRFLTSSCSVLWCPRQSRQE